jgi:hypothetical protein
LAAGDEQAALTPLEQNKNIVPVVLQAGNFAMSETAAMPEISRYEQACDQAIAMCDGNMRSTIKALIMANEYLEAELQELQTVQAPASPHHTPAKRLRTKDDAA